MVGSDWAEFINVVLAAFHREVEVQCREHQHLGTLHLKRLCIQRNDLAGWNRIRAWVRLSLGMKKKMATYKLHCSKSSLGNTVRTLYNSLERIYWFYGSQLIINEVCLCLNYLLANLDLQQLLQYHLRLQDKWWFAVEALQGRRCILYKFLRGYNIPV